jgi:hypothetical protein
MLGRHGDRAQFPHRRAVNGDCGPGIRRPCGSRFSLHGPEWRSHRRWNCCGSGRCRFRLAALPDARPALCNGNRSFSWFFRLPPEILALISGDFVQRVVLCCAAARKKREEAIRSAGRRRRLLVKFVSGNEFRKRHGRVLFHMQSFAFRAHFRPGFAAVAPFFPPGGKLSPTFHKAFADDPEADSGCEVKAAGGEGGGDEPGSLDVQIDHQQPGHQPSNHAFYWNDVEPAPMPREQTKDSRQENQSEDGAHPAQDRRASGPRPHPCPTHATQPERQQECVRPSDCIKMSLRYAPKSPTQLRATAESVAVFNEGSEA